MVDTLLNEVQITILFSVPSQLFDGVPLLDSGSADHVATSFAHIINTTHPILALQKPARVEGLVLYEGHAFEYMNSVHGVKVCVWY